MGEMKRFNIEAWRAYQAKKAAEEAAFKEKMRLRNEQRARTETRVPISPGSNLYRVPGKPGIRGWGWGGNPATPPAPAAPVAPAATPPVPQAAPAPQPAAQPAPLPTPTPPPSGLAQPSTNAFPNNQPVQPQPQRPAAPIRRY